MAEHYYSKKQTSKLKFRKVKARLLGSEFEFYTAPGVFSQKYVDKGTEILVNNCVVKDNWHILDIGCGYGVVAIALMKNYKGIKATMSDVNKRSLMLARKNIKAYGLEKDAEVIESDVYGNISRKSEFDAILCNPPQSAGKEICFKIIEVSQKFLKKGGLLQIVARHNKGGRQLSRKMKEVFGNVMDIAKKSGYRVYVSKKG